MDFGGSHTFFFFTSPLSRIRVWHGLLPFFFFFFFFATTTKYITTARLWQTANSLGLDRSHGFLEPKVNFCLSERGAHVLWMGGSSYSFKCTLYGHRTQCTMGSVTFMQSHDCRLGASFACLCKSLWSKAMPRNTPIYCHSPCCVFFYCTTVGHGWCFPLSRSVTFGFSVPVGNRKWRCGSMDGTHGPSGAFF